MLVVEDEPDVREGLVELLDAEGFPVVAAANGREALQRLRTEPRPRLVLLDLMMPVVDGWGFREEQQLDGDVADIPVVVLSANVAAARPGDGLERLPGLRKPVDVAELVATVDRYRSA